MRTIRSEILERAKKQKHIGEGVIFRLGGLHFVNQVLQQHDLKLVYGYTHPDFGTYFEVKKINQARTRLTPCFQRIESCGHIRNCYLAPKCPAALNYAKKHGIPCFDFAQQPCIDFAQQSCLDED